MSSLTKTEALWEERKFGNKGNPLTDLRGAFQRDRDRILYSNAFRRLAGVTQVISPVQGEYVHNRLIHSLKVAQIARRLAERLIRDSSPELLRKIGGIDPDVCEAAALAHDLGHPPFGHIGEHALNSVMKEGGYEGNAQSFRIVTCLAVKKNQHRGLDLTRATLNGILKSPWVKGKNPSAAKKWGAYLEEIEYFNWTRECPLVENQRSIEAQIMDWADDLTYAVHDVEDFYKAGLIPLNSLAWEEGERQLFLECTQKRWKTYHPSRISRWDTYESAFRLFIGRMDITGAYIGKKEQQAALSKWTSELITRCINAPEIDNNSTEAKPILSIGIEYQDEVNILKELNWHYVIESVSLRTQQEGCQAIVKELFNIYSNDEDKKLTPIWLEAELDDEVSSHRRAADLISSLTDKQAIILHQQLTGRNVGVLQSRF